MQGVRSLNVERKSSVKNGEWEIILTDPSLNKFSFGKQLSNNYITTDITSPFGEESILYNTIPSEADDSVVVQLNFAEIEQTRISAISIKASKTFFENWKISLKDNRYDIHQDVLGESAFDVEPVIELNKLMKMGFSNTNLNDNKTYFELHLQKISS